MKNRSKAKMVLAKTEAGTVKKVKSTGEIVVEPKDGRSLSSPWNHFVNGKFANLPTILCNYCPIRAKAAGGNGKCEAYKKNSVCGLENKFTKLFEGIDTRNVKTLQDLADLVISKRSVRELTLMEISARSNSKSDDRKLDRNNGILVQWVKLQAELIAPRITAREAEMRKNADGSFDALFREVMHNGITQENSGNLTIGVKSTADNIADTVELAKKQAEHKDFEVMM